MRSRGENNKRDFSSAEYLQMKAVDFLTHMDSEQEHEFIDSMTDSVRLKYFHLKNEIFWSTIQTIDEVSKSLPLLPAEHTTAIRVLMENYSVSMMNKLLKRRVMEEKLGKQPPIRPGHVPRKLSPAAVQGIFKQFATEQLNIADLARAHRVSKQTIRSVLSRKTWSNIPVDPRIKAIVDERLEDNRREGRRISTKRLSNRDRSEIQRLILEGSARQTDIAEQFGVSQSTVSNIKKKLARRGLI